MTHAHERPYGFATAVKPLAAWSVPGGQWEPVCLHAVYATCTRCSSIEIDRAIELLSTPGTRWSFKHPSRITLHVANRLMGEPQFYGEHMRDATDAQRVLWNMLVAPQLGFRYAAHASGELSWHWTDTPASSSTTRYGTIKP